MGKLIDQYKIHTDKTTYHINIYSEDSEKFECYVWAHEGSLSILDKKFTNKDDMQTAIHQAIEQFEKDKIHCCDCGKECDYQDIRYNRYFAGIYCDDCWNRKWKAIEEAETYE